MPNRLQALFANKKSPVLNIYCTAGYPQLNSTTTILKSLEESGADIIEIGMPYSDPLADGPVIQGSNMKALENGMTISLLYEQLEGIRTKVSIPIILMGYLNPVLQFGMENFCAAAHKAGVDGLILPDLPLYEFETIYRDLFKKYELDIIFLVTPETNEDRIRKIDSLSNGFIYAVSSSSTTGSNVQSTGQEAYLQRLQSMQLKNPILVGFGIHDRASFQDASRYTNGAIIGSAYIKALETSQDVEQTTKDFLKMLIG